ncbi:uncharacterized protein LOC126981618 isoform X2 [Eriocheir sinensis]|uniref:uncharacterized protein LOC126981618 isoform X2 n=1 Tax=Eriocheir sinensis TaxID=95602 RepID=UPI0021C7EC3D|nr:uncharacterized protein LOC126981618 isoform X2 [Eriocheir sinensis]
MGKLLLVAAAAVLVSALVGGGGRGGGGGGIFAAADRPIVFAPDLPATNAPSIVTTKPPPCLARSTLGGDVCEEDPDYDDSVKRRVLSLLSQDTGVNALLSDPNLRTLLNDPDPDIKDITIHTRVGVSESPVCAAQETIIYPKRAKTSREDWVFVLNQEGVQQALRVEKCISNGSSCNIGMGLPGGATAICRQKYVYRRMLVLGTNKIEPEEVLMPSCCVCYTTYQNLLTRSRNATGGQTPAADASAAPPAPGAPPPVVRRMNLNFGRSMGNRNPIIAFPGRR